MDVELLPHQYEAIYSLFDDPNGNHKKGGYSLVGLVGGIGSGKTWCAAVWVVRQLQRALQGDHSMRLITASTYGQLRRATLTEIFESLTAWGLSFKYNQQRGILTVEGILNILCAGVDPSGIHALRGVNIGSWLADECAYYDSMEVWNVVSGRLRDRRGDNKTFAITSPNGMNFFYDIMAGHLFNERTTKLIIARTTDNIHLDDDYVDRLKSQMSEKMAQQELEGLFIKEEGTAYYAWNRQRHLGDFSSFANMGQAIIGLDFNISPFCATICRIIHDRIYVVDEVYLEEADTYQMCAELKSRGYAHYQVIADSTFNQRKTSGKSDKIILEENGFDCSMTRRNPLQVDRVANVNRLLEQNRILVDEKCKKLVRDLEQVNWLNNKLNQITDKTLSHISDSLGYVAYNLFNGYSRRNKANIFTRER